jgi:hypothetical protein
MTHFSQFLELFSEKNKHLKGTELLQKAKTSFMKLQQYYEQDGGGNCTLCGSEGTNKSTCPRNPGAKNPNPAKHPNAGKPQNASKPQNAPAAVPLSVKANTPVMVRQKSVKIADYIGNKVDELGMRNENLQSLSDLELEYIINDSISLDLSSENDRKELEKLKKLISNTKFKKGWKNCFTEKLEKFEEESFYNQLVSRIQCYAKYSDESYLIDKPKPVVKANSVKAPALVVPRANSVKANAPVTRPANQAQPLVMKKGKTAPANNSRGCVQQSDKKYTERPSPPFPANQCCGMIMLGNDERAYQSRADKNGTCRWVLYK